MIIYRFEKNGIGPYMGRSNVGLGMFLRHECKTKAQKKYRRQFELLLKKAQLDRNDQYYKAHKSKKYLYGCASKEQLRAYFGIYFKELFKQGYRIKRYKVPDEEVIDIVVEVAFPVKYHKLRTVHGVKKRMPFYN